MHEQIPDKGDHGDVDSNYQTLGGTRGEDESGRDHGPVIFASVVLAVLGFSSLLDGMAAISRSHVFVANAQYVGNLRIWGWVVLILAVDYPDRATMAVALASDARKKSRAATERVIQDLFSGRIYHQVTELRAFLPI